MPEPEELNEMLQGRKILSVEPGTTPGWMIINVENSPDEREAQPDLRLFLTVFIGGRKGSSDASHSSTSTPRYAHVVGATSEEIVFCGRTERLFQLERRLGCNGAQFG